MSETGMSKQTKRPSVWTRFRDVQTVVGIGVLLLIWMILQ